MLKLPIWVNIRDIADTSKGDDSRIGKLLSATDHRKLNVISYS